MPPKRPPKAKSFQHALVLPYKGLVLDAKGLRWPGDGRGDLRPLEPDQIATAVLWIEMWMSPSFQDKRAPLYPESSYDIKHDVEAWQRWCKAQGYYHVEPDSNAPYISNGALIQAFLDLGYWIKGTTGQVNCRVYAVGSAWLSWRPKSRP